VALAAAACRAPGQVSGGGAIDVSMGVVKAVNAAVRFARELCAPGCAGLPGGFAPAVAQV